MPEKKKIIIELTPLEAETVLAGLTELENSGEWTYSFPEKDINAMYSAVDLIREKIIKQRK